MNIFLRKLYGLPVVWLLAGFLLSGVKVSASHITGGNLTYALAANGTYSVQLQLYFDQLGNPGALDSSVQVGVFDTGSQQAVTTLDLPLTANQQAFCAPACGYCVNILTYSLAGVTLPAPAAGLKLVYERCCRSNGILNIPQPAEVGFFMWAIIPPVPNSAAVISSPVPPLFLLSTANALQVSASDADGDELHYRLDDLYFGSATATNPVPTQNAFSSLMANWATGYATTNMLSGSQPLQIDYTTGQITAIPGTQGLFQIAYVVEEHRNGQIINGTRNEALVFVVDPSDSCLPVAVPEKEMSGVKVFPNPTPGYLVIELPEAKGDALAHVEILTSTGQLLRVQSISGGRAEIDLSGLANGHYLVKVQQAELAGYHQVVVLR